MFLEKYFPRRPYVSEEEDFSSLLFLTTLPIKLYLIPAYDVKSIRRASIVGWRVVSEEALLQSATSADLGIKRLSFQNKKLQDSLTSISGDSYRPPQQSPQEKLPEHNFCFSIHAFERMKERHFPEMSSQEIRFYAENNIHKARVMYENDNLRIVHLYMRDKDVWFIGDAAKYPGKIFLRTAITSGQIFENRVKLH